MIAKRRRRLCRRRRRRRRPHGRSTSLRGTAFTGGAPAKRALSAALPLGRRAVCAPPAAGHSLANARVRSWTWRCAAQTRLRLRGRDRPPHGARLRAPPGKPGCPEWGGQRGCRGDEEDAVSGWQGPLAGGALGARDLRPAHRLRRSGWKRARTRPQAC